MLFFLVSLLAAILFGAEAMSRLQLQLPGFSFVTAGAAALCLGTLWILNRLAKPEEKIAVFHVYDEHGQPVNLQAQGAFNTLLAGSGLQVTPLLAGVNTLLVVFPEQVDEVELHVKKTDRDKAYAGKIKFAGTRQARLVLGKDLKQ
jgi:hypothetical protein